MSLLHHSLSLLILWISIYSVVKMWSKVQVNHMIPTSGKTIYNCSKMKVHLLWLYMKISRNKTMWISHHISKSMNYSINTIYPHGNPINHPPYSNSCTHSPQLIYIIGFERLFISWIVPKSFCTKFQTIIAIWGHLNAIITLNKKVLPLFPWRISGVLTTTITCLTLSATTTSTSLCFISHDKNG